MRILREVELGANSASPICPTSEAIRVDTVHWATGDAILTDACAANGSLDLVRYYDHPARAGDEQTVA